MSNYSATANYSLTASPTLPPASSTANSGPVRQTGTPLQAQGAPYPPQVAQLGGTPTVPLDVPICAALLLLFVAGAAAHLAIFQRNRERGLKFVFSAILFGFCMARIVALSMRIAWAEHPTNVRVALAANIFTAAGVLLLFVVNLVLAQRVLRAYHPRFGWHPAVTIAFWLLFASVVTVLVMVVTVTLQSFFTLDADTRRIDRTVQLVCATCLAAVAFLPIPIVLAARLWSRRKPVEKFGMGRFRVKVRLLLGTTALLTLGAAFRAAVAFAARPVADPAWYDGKAPYYIFNYGIELAVVFAYAAGRFDRRFHVPDGSRKPGDYGQAASADVTDGSSTLKDSEKAPSKWSSMSRMGAPAGVPSRPDSPVPQLPEPYAASAFRVSVPPYPEADVSGYYCGPYNDSRVRGGHPDAGVVLDGYCEGPLDGYCEGRYEDGNLTNVSGSDVPVNGYYEDGPYNDNRPDAQPGVDSLGTPCPGFHAQHHHGDVHPHYADQHLQQHPPFWDDPYGGGAPGEGLDYYEYPTADVERQWMEQRMRELFGEERAERAIRELYS